MSKTIRNILGALRRMRSRTMEGKAGQGRE